MRARDADVGPDDDTGLLAPEHLFAVVIVWEGGAWVGWLTTIHHRSACFSVADLTDPRFQAWLAALPGWQPARMDEALTEPGMHLVWRRPAD